ncbi:MAG: hypothetical protein ABI947_07210 [Chloroflexota bacterium]
MSNLPQDPVETEPESEPSFIKYVGDVAVNTYRVIRTALFFAPVFIVIIIVILALLGTSIGNIFSNITNSL